MQLFRDPLKDAVLREHNGKVFILHPTLRFDPVTATVLFAAGTGIQMYGQYKAGKQAEKVAKYNAAVERKKAEQVKDNAKTEAQIQAEKGRRLLATQKATAAAGNVRINTGAPLVIEDETKAKIGRDIGYILRRGDQQADALYDSANITEKVGENAREQSYWNMAGTGLTGASSIAFMGSDAGWFGGPQLGTSYTNTLTESQKISKAAQLRY